MGLAIRWTVGDVSGRGFVALRLSVLGAQPIFGGSARYAICVNTIAAALVSDRLGNLPHAICVLQANADIPEFLRPHLDAGLAEGVAWKFAPMRLFPNDWEIALDNDCVLWAMPEGIRQWLGHASCRQCLLAEDVTAAFGRFAALCGDAPRNTGIRGLPPGFDLAGALAAVLAAYPARLASELDEQGLQVAALSQHQSPFIVSLDDVSICSPFPPHLSHPGRCGAHFVGLNVHRVRPYCDHTAMQAIAANWDRWQPMIALACGRRAD